jgi:hypothetical protein
MASEPAWTMFDSTFEGVKSFSSLSSSQQKSLKNMGATVIAEAQQNGFKTTPAKAISTLAGFAGGPYALIISVSASAVDMYQSGSFSGLAGNAGSQFSDRLMDQNKIKNPWIKAISSIFSGLVFSSGVDSHEKSQNNESDQSKSFLRKPNVNPDGTRKEPWQRERDRLGNGPAPSAN